MNKVFIYIPKRRNENDTNSSISLYSSVSRWRRLGGFLFDQSGVFTAVTDFGNFAHWFSLGRNESIEKCLISRRPDQILCKIAKEDVIDIEGTITYIKKNLLYDRREGRFTEDDARTEWKLIEELQVDLEEYSNEVAFQYWYDQTKIQFDDGYF
ncbi:hypothetical protein [Bacillus thuringiensis]|uniref:hypothetical protein n=1 Tax=Bacillus thuringiensis TaxID=1428 RepID=UPI0020CF7448|nr:hypothetical protein [Bacillus thuringiensis]